MQTPKMQTDPTTVFHIEGDGWEHHDLTADQVRDELQSFTINEWTAEKIRVTDGNGQAVPIELNVTVNPMRYDEVSEYHLSEG